MLRTESSIRGNSSSHAGRIALRPILLCGVLLSMMFDFRRGAEDQSNFVVVMGILNMVLGTTLVLYEGKMSRTALWAIMPSAIFLFGGISSGLLRGQTSYSVFAMAVPLVIFIVTTLAVAGYPRNTKELSQLLTAIAGFSIATALWKVAFGFGYYGLTLSDVRYQILSGATPLLFAYSVAAFIVGYRRFAWMALALSLGVVALSITRSYLGVFVASLVVGLMLTPRTRMRSTLVGLVGLLVAGLIGLFVLQSAAPELTERWISRMSVRKEVGFDVTAATRLAEINFQVERLLSEPAGLMFGFGLAARTELSGEQAVMVRSVLGEQGYNFNGHGYGHNFYVGLLYVGGIFFGSAVFISFFVVVIRGIKFSRRYLARIAPEQSFQIVWGTSASIGYLVYGLLGGNFGDRSISFFQGVAFGLLIGALSRGWISILKKTPKVSAVY